MWLSRRTAGLAAVAFALAGTAGCGFQPLYGGATGKRVARELAAIEILPVDGRLGVAMRNDLLDGLAPRAFEDALYTLEVETDPTTSAQVTERNALIRRYRLRLAVRYVLRSKAGGPALTSGRVLTEASYNIVTGEDYSTLVAERNAADQAVRDASREIVLRLSVYFDRQASR